MTRGRWIEWTSSIHRALDASREDAEVLCAFRRGALRCGAGGMLHADRQHAIQRHGGAATGGVLRTIRGGHGDDRPRGTAGDNRDGQ